MKKSRPAQLRFACPPRRAWRPLAATLLHPPPLSSARFPAHPPAPSARLRFAYLHQMIAQSELKRAERMMEARRAEEEVFLALAQLGLFGSVRRRLSPLAAVLSDLPLRWSARHTIDVTLGESSAAEASVSRSTSLDRASASPPRTFVSAKLLRARSAAKLQSEGASGVSQTMTPSQSHGAIPKGDAAAHAAAARAAESTAEPSPTAPERGDDEDGATVLSQCELVAVYSAVSSAPSRSAELRSM